MQKIFILSVTLLAFALMIPAYAEESHTQTLSELVENAKASDGDTVTMTVEMIGDVMSRGDHAWVNGLDSTGAIGLWMPDKMASEINVLGSGKYTGDVFAITGIFHRACAEHGGDMDIHVISMKLMVSGHPSDQGVSRTKLLYAVLLSLVGLIFGGVFFRRRFV